MHHPVLRVGHQPDQVLVGGDAKGKSQQLVLHSRRAERTLQIIGRAVLQAKTGKISKYSMRSATNNTFKVRLSDNGQPKDGSALLYPVVGSLW